MAGCCPRILGTSAATCQQLDITRGWHTYTYQPRFESIAGRALHRSHVNAHNFIRKRLLIVIRKYNTTALILMKICRVMAHLVSVDGCSFAQQRRAEHSLQVGGRRGRWRPHLRTNNQYIYQMQSLSQRARTCSSKMTPAHNFAMLVLPKAGIKRRKEDKRFTVIQLRAGFCNHVKILRVPVPGFPVNIALRELARVSFSSTSRLKDS